MFLSMISTLENGVSELINLCMSALLDDGDEILIPSRITRSGPPAQRWPVEKAVHYICDEQSEWYPDIDDMRKKNHRPHKSDCYHQSE